MVDTPPFLPLCAAVITANCVRIFRVGVEASVCFYGSACVYPLRLSVFNFSLVISVFCWCRCPLCILFSLITKMEKTGVIR